MEETLRPRVRVAGILIENNKILLIEHLKKNKKYWLVPGGGVDWGESTAEALIREYKEETNLDITVEKYDDSLQEQLQNKLKNYGLNNSKIKIYQTIEAGKSNQKEFDKLNTEIELLKTEIKKMKTQ